MPISSDAIALGRITAGQMDTNVWVGRVVSADAWRRCHLACHWFRSRIEIWSFLAQGFDRWVKPSQHVTDAPPTPWRSIAVWALGRGRGMMDGCQLRTSVTR